LWENFIIVPARSPSLYGVSHAAGIRRSAALVAAPGSAQPNQGRARQGSSRQGRAGLAESPLADTRTVERENQRLRPPIGPNVSNWSSTLPSA